MRILAVDDDPTILELLSVLIGQIGGHELTCVESPLEALSLIAKSKDELFDCILLDIDMPGISGIDLCWHIRSLPIYAETPILMVTRMVDKAHVDDSFAAGANDYLNKPFEINELKGRLNIITKAVQKKNLEPGQNAPIRHHVRTSSEFGLHSPIRLFDIDRTVEYSAMENYVSQLSRNSLFGSSVFAIKIIGVEDLFETVSPFEFKCLVADVAEAISDTFNREGVLISYSGNGTYVCVADCGWRPNPDHLVEMIERQIEEMDLHLNDGTSIAVRVCAGRAIRLLSRHGTSAIDALLAAQVSVDGICSQMEHSPLGMCLARYSK